MDVPRFLLVGSPELSGNDLIGHISMRRLLEAYFVRNPNSITPCRQGEESPRTNRAQLVT